MARKFEAIIILTTSLMALSAAGVWLRTEWSHRREAAMVERVLTGKPLDEKALARDLTGFLSSFEDFLPGEHLFYASTLALSAADLSGIPRFVRLEWLDRARNILPAALAREPAHTHSWMHLAYAEWVCDGPNRKSIDALRMSIYTSPADKQLLLWRLRLAGLNRELWDTDFRDLLMDQVSLAWRHSPKTLAETAVSHHIDDLVRQVLQNDPAELGRFETLAAKSSHP